MAAAVSRFDRRLRAVEQGLFALRQEYDAMSHGDNDDRWQKLLTLVEDAGGRVSSADWRRLGVLCNYDTRGLGGFYRGDKPSMEVDGDDRVLTARGRELLDEYGRRR